MDVKSLEKAFDPKALTTDPKTLEQFAVDGIKPQAAVLPGTLDEAARLIKMANQEGFTLSVQGGGTKSSIGGALKNADVALCTSRLDKIIDMDTANLTVTVQSGVLFGDVQDLLMGLENRCYFPLDSDLKEKADYMCSDRDYKGAFIPVDPPLAHQSSFGGIAAANATGPMRMRFRPLRDLILGVRFVAPTGEIIGMGGKTVKNVSGYDVSKLMIGSQGCLGLVGEITIRLLPLPEKTGAMVFLFQDLAGAQAFVKKVIDSKLLPTAVEVLNRGALALTGTAVDGLKADGLAVAVGQAGVEEEVDREVKDLKDLAGGSAEVLELDDKAAAEFWRELGDQALERAKVRFKANYQFSGYADFMAEAAAAGEGCAFFVSAGSSVSQIHFLEEAEARAAEAGRRLREKALNLKGALVVEAAGPEFKKEFDVWGPERSDWILMKRAKMQLDPNGVLNPGRFVGGL